MEINVVAQCELIVFAVFCGPFGAELRLNLERFIVEMQRRVKHHAEIIIMPGI